MPLNVTRNKIKDWETVCRIPDPENVGSFLVHPVTHILEVLTIAIGMGQITKDNWKEFYARFNLLEKLDGPFLHDSTGQPYRITPEDVYKHIGLSTNVAEETRASFIRRVVGNELEDSVRRAIRCEKNTA